MTTIRLAVSFSSFRYRMSADFFMGARAEFVMRQKDDLENIGAAILFCTELLFR